MSLAVVSTEAAPVYPLPSTAEGGSPLFVESASKACQVGYLALVSKSSTMSLTASHALLPG